MSGPGRVVENAANMMAVYIDKAKVPKQRKNNNSNGTFGNNNKDDDNDDTEQKQTTLVLPSPTLIWKEETVIPATLQDLPPRCIPLKIEPETTTSYDIGCQIAMLTQTAYQDW